MTLLEAIQKRHSVRQYVSKPIPTEAVDTLEKEIQAINTLTGLHIQLYVNEPNAFTGMMAKYGKFENVENYIALVGLKKEDIEEMIGYYGEKLVLLAMQLGLNTCWVASTYSRKRSEIDIASGEKVVCVIALGYGKTQGNERRTKPYDVLAKCGIQETQWFKAGVEAAMLAPTAMNQQKFLLTLLEEGVRAQTTGGFFSKVDLGIVKYHFEVAAGTENFKWL